MPVIHANSAFDFRTILISPMTMMLMIMALPPSQIKCYRAMLNTLKKGGIDVCSPDIHQHIDTD